MQFGINPGSWTPTCHEGSEGELNGCALGQGRDLVCNLSKNGSLGEGLATQCEQGSTVYSVVDDVPGVGVCTRRATLPKFGDKEYVLSRPSRNG